MARRPDIEITPGACIYGALMLLILPLRWVFGALFAVVVHELWHWTAIRLCGGDVYALRISAAGAVMETTPQTRWRELVCAAAGPVGSFSLLLGVRVFPVAALCGLAQGLFNLLPLFPLDGGRILRCSLEMMFPRIYGKIIRRIERGFFWLVAAAGICVALRLGMRLLILLLLPVAAARVFPKKNTLQRIQSGGTIGTD